MGFERVTFRRDSSSSQPTLMRWQGQPTTRRSTSKRRRSSAESKNEPETDIGRPGSRSERSRHERKCEIRLIKNCRRKQALRSPSKQPNFLERKNQQQQHKPRVVQINNSRGEQIRVVRVCGTPMRKYIGYMGGIVYRRCSLQWMPANVFSSLIPQPHSTT